MDPRLVRAVEIPERRSRPLFAMTAVAVLFAFGSYSYVQTASCPARTRTAILTFNTEPPGAAVAEVGEDRVLCVTPCDLEVRAGVDDFRLIAPGHQPMQVLVNSYAGDVRVDAMLVPLGE
jgi:hypothetical protein